MLLDGIIVVQNGRNTPLSIGRIAATEFCLGYHRDMQPFVQMQGRAKSGRPATQYQDIIIVKFG
jgi:hypothetical protein